MQGNRPAMIKLKRIYQTPQREDGLRILVDRLWPRGISKEKSCVDLWLKGIAPSDSLRKWFSHDPEKWLEFRRRYFEELKGKRAALPTLRLLKRKGKPITLLYAAKDPAHNNAVVLREVLRAQATRKKL